MSSGSEAGCRDWGVGPGTWPEPGRIPQFLTPTLPDDRFYDSLRTWHGLQHGQQRPLPRAIGHSDVMQLGWPVLLSQAQPLNDLLIALRVCLFQIGEVPPPLTNQLVQAPP
jgi:hypothetical protein